MADPLVSIGMPVHNAERHLGGAIESLIGQDHTNLELIISDNASSDGTESICREYARRDARIRYVRSDANQGAVWNFNRVYELAQGPYFMWAAHDDLRDRAYVSSCVAALEAHPSASLCCTEVEFIDDNGARVEPWTTLIHPVGTSPRARVSQIARSRYWLDVYGLTRKAALDRTTRARQVWGFDVSILLQLCLLGPVLIVREQLFKYRVDTGKTTAAVAATLGDAESRGAIGVNWSAMTLQLLGDVRRAPLGRLRRTALTAQLLVQLCVFNGLVGSGIRDDVLANLRAAVKSGRSGRALGLCVMAALTFPVHNRLVRGLVRKSRPRRAATQLHV